MRNDDGATAEVGDDATVRPGIPWAKVLAYGVLPAVAVALALSAGALRYADGSVRRDERAGRAAMEAAKATAVAMLTYTPGNVAGQLHDARALLTGEFLVQYSLMTDGVVIPGARAQRISAVTTVPAAAVVSADERHAVVLLFLDQTITVDTKAPTVTTSSARATLDEVNGAWLITQFTYTS